jgi:hypothetical protein
VTLLLVVDGPLAGEYIEARGDHFQYRSTTPESIRSGEAVDKTELYQKYDVAFSEIASGRYETVSVYATSTAAVDDWCRKHEEQWRRDMGRARQ